MNKHKNYDDLKLDIESNLKNILNKIFNELKINNNMIKMLINVLDKNYLNASNQSTKGKRSLLYI